MATSIGPFKRIVSVHFGDDSGGGGDWPAYIALKLRFSDPSYYAFDWGERVPCGVNEGIVDGPTGNSSTWFTTIYYAFIVDNLSLPMIYLPQAPKPSSDGLDDGNGWFVAESVTYNDAEIPAQGHGATWGHVPVSGGHRFSPVEGPDLTIPVPFSPTLYFRSQAAPKADVVAYPFVGAPSCVYIETDPLFQHLYAPTGLPEGAGAVDLSTLPINATYQGKPLLLVGAREEQVTPSSLGETSVLVPKHVYLLFQTT